MQYSSANICGSYFLPIPKMSHRVGSRSYVLPITLAILIIKHLNIIIYTIDSYTVKISASKICNLFCLSAYN